jgi:hypothetical protein
MLSSPLAFSAPVVLEQGVKALTVSIDGQAVPVSGISYEIVKGRAFCKENVNIATGLSDFSIWYADEVFSYAKSKKMSPRVAGITTCQDLTVSKTPIDGDEVEVLLYSNEFVNTVLSTAFAGKW